MKIEQEKRKTKLKKDEEQLREKEIQKKSMQFFQCMEKLLYEHYIPLTIIAV